MTTLTLTSVVLVLFGLLTRLGWPRAMSLGGATAAGVAFALNDRVIVPTFYFVALAALAATALAALGRHRVEDHARPIPGMVPLLFFGLWTTAITAVGAVLFSGAPVLDAAGRQVSLGEDGLLTTSNIAQLLYLWIGIGVFVVVARSPSTGIDAVGLGLVVATLLNTWALLHREAGLPFLVGFFDNSPGFRFIDSAPGGVERFRGIEAEPSALSGIAIPMLVFALACVPRVTGWKRVGALLMAGLALWNGIASTSTSFIVSGVLMAVVAVVFGVGSFLLRRVRVHASTWLIIVVAVIVTIFVVPAFMTFVADTVNSKIDSSSYDDRSGADAFSFRLAAHTIGIGVGLGSNRPSSFVASLLSQTGILGLALFVLFIAQVARRAATVQAVRPVLWVGVSMLIGKVYNGPDMSDSSGLLWLVLGVLAHAALNPQGRTDPDSGESRGLGHGTAPPVPVGPRRPGSMRAPVAAPGGAR